MLVCVSCRENHVYVYVRLVCVHPDGVRRAIYDRVYVMLVYVHASMLCRPYIRSSIYTIHGMQTPQTEGSTSLYPSSAACAFAQGDFS